ncbi:MAG: glycosyl hydrolase family 2 [Alistipes sp.]|nr:glycosyl hydrolase family 2 [Alistipes sp.]
MVKYTLQRILLPAVAAAALFASCSPEGGKTETGWPDVTVEAKPGTRWWWMGSDVDSAGLSYNLGEMARVGLGTVEITPIYGVKGREDHYIDYLSQRWMDMVGFTITEAERLGMKVDMNTGTGWPFGGPEIDPQDGAATAITVVHNVRGGQKLTEKIEVPEYFARQRSVAYLERVVANSGDGQHRLDITGEVADDGTLEWNAPEGDDWEVTSLFVGRTLQAVKRAAPGGAGLVMDHLDGDVVKKYLGKYDQAFNSTGTPYPSTFFNDSYEVFGADWTPSLLAEFERRRGYKLELYLPELLGQGRTDASVRVITNYRETMGELLLENFTRPWTEWAHSHGAITRNQAHGSPANLIDIYAAVDIPECETFGISDFDIPYLRHDEIRKENDGDPTILKYASSAAHITGKKYTSAESLTWLTDHFRTSLSQAKVELDQMFTAGVNHIFFHGYTYTPEDAPWPGWKFYATIDFSPTNAFWNDAPALTSYITRVQSFLQYGQPDNDYLLYLPIYDMWAEPGGSFYKAFSIHGLRERLPDFCDAVDNIMQAGYDVDYISDRYIASTGVDGGKIVTEGGVSYKALILPSVTIIPETTMAKVRELIERGATVIFSDHYPSEVPGLYGFEERRGQLEQSLRGLPEVDFATVQVSKVGQGSVITGKGYAGLLPATGITPESFSTEHGGQLIRRSNGSGHHYFMTMLRNRPVDGWVTLGVDAAAAMIYNPLDGSSGRAKVRKADGRTQVYLQLKPGQSVIVKTFDKDIKGIADWTYLASATAEVPVETGWTLDFPESDPEIGETFGIGTLGSWTDLDDERLGINRGRGRYSVTVPVEKKDGLRYVISLGHVRESARVKVNGREAGVLISPPFETDITDYLNDGDNSLEIEVTNLAANRIADYDRRGVVWRIFHDTNIVDLNYRQTPYSDRAVVESGLLGPVLISEYPALEL